MYTRESSMTGQQDLTLSLSRLLEPDVLADPYPLYHRLQDEDSVHWDPFLHIWVVTCYSDVITILTHFLANRTPTPEQLITMGLPKLAPIAKVLVRQMLFMDGASHARIRGLAATAFTPRRVEQMRSHIQDITDRLLDAVQENGQMDVIADLADPLPAIVTAELLGVPTSDWRQLTAWSTDFAEALGNFQHNPDHTNRVLHSLDEMYAYFRAAILEKQAHPGDDLISALLSAEKNGDRLSEEEVVANSIMLMTGGQETTTNLIGNGTLTLLHHPDQLDLLRADPSLVHTAIEEMLRYESPIQYTTRLTPGEVEMGGKTIPKGQAVIAAMGAANRDPQRFPDPDRFDIRRQDNRHLAFAWAAHFCFGAPLARLEAEIAFTSMLRRMPDLTLDLASPAWRDNLGFRGLTALPISF